MSTASRSGYLVQVAIAAVALAGLVVGCGGDGPRSRAADSSASDSSSASSDSAPRVPTTIDPVAPPSVAPSPSPQPAANSQPSAPADASSADPAIAFRGLDAARRELYAAPDAARVSAIWDVRFPAYEIANREVRALAAAEQRVTETGFELQSVIVIYATATDAALRIVLGPGDGYVEGTDRTWQAANPVTFDVTLALGIDARWRIATDTEIGSIGASA